MMMMMMMDDCNDDDDDACDDYDDCILGAVALLLHIGHPDATNKWSHRRSWVS